MNISIFGLGYVGSVSLACLAMDGHRVTGVDINPGKLRMIAAGEPPVIEAGMPELMRAAVESGRVEVTADVRAAIARSDVSFITVGTPSAPDSSVNQEALLSVTAAMGEALASKDGYHLFVFRSTVAPGTTEQTLLPLLEERSQRRCGADFDICFQPEFLREGSSIHDYRNPPMTVIGTRSARAIETLQRLFGHLPGGFHATSIRTAEMLKICCNDFHSLKIAFANEVARLAHPLGCDPFEILSLLCQDRQLNISPAYLRPGFAFGGSCLPKDLRSTLHLAQANGVELPLLAAVLPSNRIHLRKAVDLVLATGARRAGMIGLSFKTGTDDLRESSFVALAEELLSHGLELAVFDPEVRCSRLMGANREYIKGALPHLDAFLREDCRDVVEGADVILLGSTAPDGVECVRRYARPGQTLIDLIGIADRSGLRCAYTGLCW